jgi:kynurenine formamidase
VTPLPAYKALPAYDELPVDPAAPPHSAWGVWADLTLGALELLDPSRVLRARECIQSGERFALDVPLDEIDPPLFDRSPIEHEILTYPSTAQDDVIGRWNTQASSQWDGFRHQRHPKYGYLGGLLDREHGVGHWAHQGIVGRAVLADVVRWRASNGRDPIRYDERDAIEPHELLACLSAQGTVIEPGDILLLHTGWLTWYRTLSAAQRRAFPPASSYAGPGLSAVPEMAGCLWDLHVAAVAGDNPTLEAYPRRDGQFLHHHLLDLLGIPIGELWDLGPLADACADDGRYDCFLTSAPTPLTGGAGSPSNAIAIR